MAGRKDCFLLVGSQSSPTSSLVGTMPTSKKLTNGLRRPPAGDQSEACFRKEPSLGQFQFQSSLFALDIRDQLRDILCTRSVWKFLFFSTKILPWQWWIYKSSFDIYMQFCFCRWLDITSDINIIPRQTLVLAKLNLAMYMCKYLDLCNREVQMWQ